MAKGEGTKAFCRAKDEESEREDATGGVAKLCP